MEIERIKRRHSVVKSHKSGRRATAVPLSANWTANLRLQSPYIITASHFSISKLVNDFSLTGNTDSAVYLDVRILYM